MRKSAAPCHEVGGLAAYVQQEREGGVILQMLQLALGGGHGEYYEEVPPWVDNLYPAGLIVQQYDYYGMYHNGFLNSIFGLCRTARWSRLPRRSG